MRADQIKRSKLIRAVSGGVVAVSAALGAASASAATLYWDANGDTVGGGNTGVASGNWLGASASPFWSTDADGTVTTGAFVTGSDVVFHAGNDVTLSAVTLGASTSVASINFQEGATTISANFNLTVGSGGISVSAASGAVAIGNASTNTSIVVNNAQTWVNNSANRLTIGRGAINQRVTILGPGQIQLGNDGGSNTFTGTGGIQIGSFDGTNYVAGTGRLSAASSGYGAGNAFYLVAGSLGATGRAKGLANSGGFVLQGDFTIDFLTDGASATALLSTIKLDGDYTLTIGSGAGPIDGSGFSFAVGKIENGVGGGTVLTKAGAGGMGIHTTNSTYTGGTVLQGGALYIAGDGSLGTAPTTVAPSNISFTGNALLGATANSNWTSSSNVTISANRGISIGNGVSATLSASNAVTTTLSVEGTISGAGSLTKSGTGVLVLNAANTYSGGTAQTGGTLVMNNAGALGTGTSYTVTNTSTLQNATGSAVSLAATKVTITSSGVLNTLGNDLSFDTLTLVGATRTVNVASGQKVSFTASANDGTARTLTKTGNGALFIGGNAQHGGALINGGILASTGTYTSTGNVNIAGGVLGLSKNGFSANRSLGTGASQIQFTGSGGFAAVGPDANWGSINNNASLSLTNGTLTVGGTNMFTSAQSIVLGSSYANGTFTLANSLLLSSTSQSLAVNRGAMAPTDGVDAVISGNISSSGGGINLSGDGTLELTGNNSYAGVTSISQARLLISGTTTNSSFSVTDGTLGGNGSTGGVNVATGGTLAPGKGGAGTLSTGNLTLAGRLLADVAKDNSDQVNVTGTVNVDGADLTLTLSPGMDVNDIVYLVKNDGTDTIDQPFGKVNGVTTNLAEGQSFAASYAVFTITYLADAEGSSFTGGNDIALQVTAVPEPASLGLLAVGGYALMARRRRERK